MTEQEVPELACPANTVLNYNLASNDQQKNQLDFLHQRLSEVKSTQSERCKCNG